MFQIVICVVRLSERPTIDENRLLMKLYRIKYKPSKNGLVIVLGRDCIL